MPPREYEIDPIRQTVQQFGADFGIGAAGTSWDVEGMVAVLKEFEGSVFAELLAERLQKFQAGEIVAGALKEEHRDLHIGKVLGAFDGGTSGWMKRESKEDETAHSGERRRSLRLRSHAAAKGFAASEKSKVGNQTRRFEHRRTHGGLSHLRRVGSFGALLHIRELVSQCRDPALGQSVGNGCHEGMCHARPRAMREDIACTRLPWRLKQARDALSVSDRYRNRLCGYGSH